MRTLLAALLLALPGCGAAVDAGPTPTATDAGSDAPTAPICAGDGWCMHGTTLDCRILNLSTNEWVPGTVGEGACPRGVTSCERAGFTVEWYGTRKDPCAGVP